MGQTVMRVTLNSLKKNGLWNQVKNISTQSKRNYSTYLANNSLEIGQIYQNLLKTDENTSTPCNFISQVVDHWGSNSNNMALKCHDLDSNSYSQYSYKSLSEKSLVLADCFKQQGLNKGDSVALMLGQNPAWWFSIAGLIRAGISIVPCPRLLTPKDLSYRINDLKIRGIIASSEVESRIDSIRSECQSLEHTITIGQGSDSWTAFEGLLDDHKTLAPQFKIGEIHTTVSDRCVYLYTSGTTGQPKAVLHNHDYPFFHWPTGKRWLQSTPEDLIYNASDTGWGFTLWITAAAWATGSQLLITPTTKKFEAQRMLDTLKKERVTIFCAAPTVLRLLVADPSFQQYKFPILRKIVTVGEALDETVIEAWAKKGVEIAVGFGQAETPLLVGRVDNQTHIPGTMGQPISPYKVAVVDENLNPLPPGSVGQLSVELKQNKRNGIFREYANAPEKTKNAFTNDGTRYLTGDWVYFREDGFLVYQGRRDDLIKSRGYRIGPDEVEKAGMSHPAVAKIAVVGIRTDKDSLGKTVKAYILLKPSYTASEELMRSIQNHIKTETAAHKHPRLVEFLSLDEWSKYETTSGKIRRAGLRERDEQKLDQEFAHAPKL